MKRQEDIRHEDFVDLGDAIAQTKGFEIVDEDTDSGELRQPGLSID